MNIFEQSDYRIIVKTIVEDLAQTQRGVYRKMAEYLGVNPSLISQVVTGTRDFNEEQIVGVCEFLGLSKSESRYILTLVQIERAGSVKLKKYHQEHLEELRKQSSDLSKRISKKRALTEAEQAKFYSSWLYPAIQLFTTFEKSPTFKDICARFHLQPSEAQSVLSFLLEMGMVIETNGHYKPGDSVTHLEKSSPYIINHHRNWRLKSMQKAETLTEEELMYSCNFSVSRKDFQEIREEMFKTIQKFLKTAQASPAEDLAQFNLDLFWL